MRCLILGGDAAGMSAASQIRRAHDDWEVVVLRISRSGLDIWNVRAPANATSLTVPQPPSAVDVNSFLGPSFQAQLLGGMIEPGATQFDRYVESRIIRLSRE